MFLVLPLTPNNPIVNKNTTLKYNNINVYLRVLKITETGRFNDIKKYVIILWKWSHAAVRYNIKRKVKNMADPIFCMGVWIWCVYNRNNGHLVGLMIVYEENFLVLLWNKK